MPELNFQIEKAEPVPYAASPQLVLKLRVTQVAENDQPLAAIHSVALRCQIRLEPGRRKYSLDEQEKLFELFGEPHRWGQTVRSTLWVNTAVVVPPFKENILVDLAVPCTYDFNVATAKYFYALEDGEVPLCLLFSGTIFYADEEGSLQVSQISWEKEANFRLSVATWKQMMQMYYPNSAWLCLRQDVFDQLYHFKSRRALPTWEQAIELLLSQAQEQVTT
jgi:hypothetical protein